MKRAPVLIAVILVLSLVGCKGNAPGEMSAAGETNYRFLSGTSSSGVSVDTTADTININFSDLDNTGRFLRFSLPSGCGVTGESWTGAERTLHLVASFDGGFEIGITPLDGWTGRGVEVELAIANCKAVSKPPGGYRNIIRDLLVSPQGDDQVVLEWTVMCAGDYDFNGEVNVADLAPLGRRFMSVIDRHAPHAHLFGDYWIDGDENGEVNLADITVIGANLHAQVTGYNVRRNGSLLSGSGEGPTIPWAGGTIRNGLPVKYTAAFSGTTEDFWEVSPVDAAGNEGTNNAGVRNVIDLEVSLDIEGLNLFDLNHPDSPGDLGLNRYYMAVIDPSELQRQPELMRRLHPGIDPDGYHIGEVFNIGAGEAVFTDLPRNRIMLLGICYMPATDLATGELWTADQIAAEDGFVCTYIPIKLPPDGLMELDARIINESPNSAAELCIRTIVSSDYGTVLTEKHLACATGLICQDTDLDNWFDDEAWLADEERIGISQQQLQAMIDLENNQYNARLNQTVAGNLDYVEEESGMLALTDAVATDSGGDWYVGDITVNFNETTNFGALVSQPGDPLLVDITPAQLATGDNMVLEADYLVNSIGVIPEKHWASVVRRTEPSE